MGDVTSRDPPSDAGRMHLVLEYKRSMGKKEKKNLVLDEFVLNYTRYKQHIESNIKSWSRNNCNAALFANLLDQETTKGLFGLRAELPPV